MGRQQTSSDHEASLTFGSRMLLSVVLLAACSSPQPMPPHDSAARSVRTDVILTVENHTRKPLLVYLESKSRSDSLGSVPKGITRSFSMPSGAADSATTLFLAARGRGTTAGVRSDGFRLSPGEQVVWTIEPTRTVVTMR